MEPQLQMDMNQLVQAIGTKELEIIYLRSQVQALQKQVQDLMPPKVDQTPSAS